MEIGPGWGNFTMELADCCDTLTCVDISEDVLRYIDRAAQECAYDCDKIYAKLAGEQVYG